MSDYPPPPPTQGPPPDEPAPESPTSRYQPYPGAGPYPGAQYPGSQYAGGARPPGGPPGAPPPGGVAPAAPGNEFQRRLGRRPEPRFTTALAGIGIAMALFGTAVWGGTYWAEGLFNSSSGDTDRNLLGAALAAVLVVAGYVVAITRRSGPLATAGVVAAGVGVPLAITFLTLDVQDSSGINYDAVFWVSVIVWAVSYAVVPGMRGHTFFVFLVATQLLSYVLSKTTDNVSGDLVAGSGPDLPSNSTIAAIGLGFGLVYYAIAFVLDRSGRHGPATGLVYPAFFATAGGIIAWSPDLELTGSGLLTIVIGLLVCWYGGRYGRRVTCFAAAGGVTVGIALLISDAVGNDGVQAGVTFLVVGLAFVAIAGLLAHALGEPDDMAAESIPGTR